MHEIEVQETKGGAVIPIRAQPGARKTRIIGTFDGAVKIAVAAKAEDGKANQALILFLANIFSVAKSRCEIISGSTHRNKRVLVHGVTAEAARGALHRAWPE